MENSLLGLAGKVAVVAGGGEGIGKATSLLLARAGARVVIGDIVGERADAVHRLVEEGGGEACAVQVDTRLAADVDRLVASALDRFGRIDVNVNIVGGHIDYAPAIDTPIEVFRSDFTLNLISTLLCSRSCARVMIGQKSGGAIVNMAAVSASHSAIGMAAYGVAKAGVVSLTQTLGAELGKYDIRVNAVAPGFLSDLRGSWTMTETGIRLIEKTVPLRRPGTPAEAAGVIVMLSSSLCSYVTGQTLNIDGGHLLPIPLLAEPDALNMFAELMKEQAENPR